MSRGAKKSDAQKREELVARVNRTADTHQEAVSALTAFDQSIRDEAAAKLAVLPKEN